VGVDIVEELRTTLGPAHVAAGGAIALDDTHDESLGDRSVLPRCVVRPQTTAEVATIVTVAARHGCPVIARGSGTGLSGAAVPLEDGIVVAFDRMDAIYEIDAQNQVAVVGPGVTLAQLDEALLPHGLVYPVNPGELSASIGGNVATNAGGMRALRYGVTRQRVLGLEAVLATGEVVRTGGKFVKSSSGYDLTQLLVGSEGTLALITEVTVRLETRLPHGATLLAPFAALGDITTAVPDLLRSGLAPHILEYLDALTMASIVQSAGVELGIDAVVREEALAYLVVGLESTHAERLDADTEAAATALAGLGALDVYVLPPTAAHQLIAARERAFYVAKAAGADEIIDVVVPRAAIADYLATVGALAEANQAFVAGCGHVGDGNVHLSVFQPDGGRRTELIAAMLAAGLEAGGAISGEHGIGTAKRAYFLAFEPPARLALLQRIKAAFDPDDILGRGRGPGPGE